MAYTEKQILLNVAKVIAEKYLKLFAPRCERIEIAGSIRREKKFIGDIELVCIPKTIPNNSVLFAQPTRDPEFVKLVNTFARVKGNGEGKYSQLILTEGMHLDLFITTPDQWGVIFMIRTGSAEFSHRMVTECKKNGYYVKDGFLWKDITMIPVPKEEDFFSITKLPYVQPKARTL